MGVFDVSSCTRPSLSRGVSACNFQLPAPKKRRKSSRRKAARAEGMLREHLGLHEGMRFKNMREEAQAEERNREFCVQRGKDLLQRIHATYEPKATIKGRRLAEWWLQQPLLCLDCLRFSVHELAELICRVDEVLINEKDRSRMVGLYSTGARVLMWLRAMAQGGGAVEATVLNQGECLHDGRNFFREGTSRFLLRDKDRISRAVIVALWDCVKWPSITELDSLMGTFGSREDLALCVGAIDCSHLPIQKRGSGGGDDDENFYCSWKHFHSVKVLVVVDWRGKILFYDIHGQLRRNMPGQNLVNGKVKGERIRRGCLPDQMHYRHSSLYLYPDLGKLREGVHVIMGDAGFSRRHFLCPLNRREAAELSPQAQLDYKALEFALAQARTVVEQTFAHIKGAWAVFKKPLPANADHFAHGRHFQAACHLHNWRCALRRTWVRGLQWKAGAPPHDWEEKVLADVLQAQASEYPAQEVHDMMSGMGPRH